MAELLPARVYVHDGNGIRLGELTTAFSINRSYRTMANSRGLVTVSENEPLLSSLDPRDGRMLVIESTVYPLPWVGMIVDFSGQRAGGTVTIEARSLDAIFAERTVPSGLSVTGTAGVGFRELIERSNDENPSGIDVAPEIASGPPYVATFGDRKLSQALTQLARDTGHEWWVEYDARADHVQATAHYRPARGVDRFGEMGLYEGPGGNIEVETHRINTDQSTHKLKVVAGQASVTQTFANRSRAARRRTAEAPIDDAPLVGVEASVHGYSVEASPLAATPLTRASRVVVLEHLRAAGLGDAADALMARPRRGERRVSLKVLNAPDTWAALLPGDVVRLEVAAPVLIDGFNGPVWVVSTQPMEEAGTLRLVTEVLRAA